MTKSINKSKCLISILFLFGFQTIFSQKFVVQVETLNVRENKDKNSNVIAQIHKNDTIIAFFKDKNWIKINIENREGFVNLKYVTEISNIVDENNINIGFVEGFKKYFIYSFILSFVLFFGYRKIKARISDSRFSSGFRDGEITFSDVLTDGIFALVIGLIFGLISGIVCWVKALF
jgi:hypothetical protein